MGLTMYIWWIYIYLLISLVFSACEQKAKEKSSNCEIIPSEHGIICTGGEEKGDTIDRDQTLNSKMGQIWGKEIKEAIHTRTTSITALICE